MHLFQVKTGNKYLELLILVILVLLAAGSSVLFNFNFLITTLLFFGLPAVYLIFLNPAHIKKALVSALLFGLLWSFSFDFIAELNYAWSWSVGESLLFPGTFFGVVSLDIMVWFFLWIFLVVMFYEHFIERRVSKKISSNIWYSVSVGTVALIVMLTLFFIDPEILKFSYTYLVLGIAALCQFLYVIVRRPHLFPKTLEVVPFFLFLYLTFEIVALHLKLWDFTGQYVGMILINNLQFPLEEFFFWILLSSAVAVSYHELYVDDQK